MFEMTDERIYGKYRYIKSEFQPFDLSKVIDRFSSRWKDSEGEGKSSTMGTYGVSFSMQRFKLVTADYNSS